MPHQDFEGKDRRRAAIHECAHAYVARHYGMFAVPRIYPTYTKKPQEEHTWRGRTSFFSEPTTMFRRRRIGIAGILAELMDDPPYEDYLPFNSLADSYYCDEWSATDYTWSSGWTSADVDAVQSILKRNWDAILREAGIIASDAIAREFGDKAS